ncbi:hypothetical protein F4782DRAFT_534312 [Xylaria castorea]|nr:hypothetical protein F4782DRAFT_534312 [Xylaria castorea]
MSTLIFHSFPRLPKELRHQVLEDCGAHLFEPGAQFFTFFSYEHREDELDALFGQTVACTRRRYATMATPRSRETGEISWSRHNKTTEWGLLRQNVLFAGPSSDFGEALLFAGPAPPFGTVRYHFGPEGLHCAAQAATDRLYWLDYLWSTDYRIRLGPGVAYTNGERHVFTGLGCKFIEVKNSDDTSKKADNYDTKKPYQQKEDKDGVHDKPKAGLERHLLPKTLEFVKKLYYSVDKYFEERFQSGWLVHTDKLN